MTDIFARRAEIRVRAEERAFGEELFDGFVADYNDARPAVVAPDSDRDNRKGKSK